jgi:FkbM family methyltransferase
MKTLNGASQLGQDFFVIEILGGMSNGFFLDSGASDGVNASNTYLLESEYGWKGICVEPNEVFFPLLKKNRTCHCVNYCLYDRDGVVDFVEASTLGGILEEYHPAHLEYAKRSFNLAEDATGKPGTVQKTAKTIRSVLRECNAPSVIDYWSLDTEGSELAILKSFPFDEYSFRVLTVEHNWLPVRKEIRQFLERKGYVLKREMGIDDCYVHHAMVSNSSWRSNAFRRKRF